MKALNRILFAGLLALPWGSFAQADGLTSTFPNQYKWVDTPFGVQASPVVGDFTKGRHVTLIKFKAGMTTPPHIHSHDYTAIVIKGIGVHYLASEKPVPFPPGTSWSVAANANHVSGCLAGEDCVFALYQDEPFDYTEKHE